MAKKKALPSRSARVPKRSPPLHGGTGGGTAELQVWETLGRSVLLSRPPWLEVYQERVRLPEGRVVDDFYRVVLPAFAIVAATTEEGQLITIRCFKQAVRRVLHCLPGGVLDRNEAPEAAARRELLEETGYAARDFTALGVYVVDGNRQCGTMHAFMARQARRMKKPRVDDMEVVRIELLPPARVAEAIAKNEFPHLPSASTFALAMLRGLQEKQPMDR